MTREDLEQRVAAYVDGQLQPDAAARFEKKMEADHVLRDWVEEERHFHAMLSNSLVEQAPDALRDRLMAALDAEDSAVASRSDTAPRAAVPARGRLYRLVAAVAAGVIIVVGGFLALQDDDPTDLVSFDAAQLFFRVHDHADRLDGDAFTREALPGTFVRMNAPDLTDLGWSFDSGVETVLPEGDDALVRLRYARNGHTFSFAMALGARTRADERIPLASERFEVVKRDDGTTGVFWREPNGMICGVVSELDEEELKRIARAIRSQSG